MGEVLHGVDHLRRTGGVNEVGRRDLGQKLGRAAEAGVAADPLAGRGHDDLGDAIGGKPVQRRAHVEIARVARRRDHHHRARRLGEAGSVRH